MLLDGAEGLRALSVELREFLKAPAAIHTSEAETNGDPSPYSEFISGLRVEKLKAGAPQLQISADRWLELRITVPDLEGICAKLDRIENGSHTHLHAAPTSLILEADDSWLEG